MIDGAAAGRVWRPSREASIYSPSIVSIGGCGQVFGLTSTPAGGRYLLAVASQSDGDQCV